MKKLKTQKPCKQRQEIQQLWLLLLLLLLLLLFFLLLLLLLLTILQLSGLIRIRTLN